MILGDRKSILNSLQSSKKVSLFTREQTTSPRTGIINVEYKWKLASEAKNGSISLQWHHTNYRYY